LRIRAENLSRVFRSGAGELVVFSGLNLEIASGERVALIGESGSGKSTLLHLLGGLERPTTGSIYFGETGIAALPPAELADFRNRAIGFVWQIHYLLPEFTAVENAMMPLLIRGVPRSEARSAAAGKLEEVGLGGRLRHRAGELSGGEQQRVALARALVGNPRVLLLDEPTGNLDHKTGEAIFALLNRLHATHRFTWVFVTHSRSLADRCDRILKIEDGSLSAAPPSAQPVRHPDVESLGA
jgi:lipoprotein-releasing system ATP-binding protein